MSCSTSGLRHLFVCCVSRGIVKKDDATMRVVGQGYDRYRQSQYAGLTRLQLDEVGRERQVQRQGARRAEALAEWSVELAQAMVPQARG